MNIKHIYQNKSVRNRCVIEVFVGRFVLSRCFLDFFCGCRGFCNRAESDLFFFLLRLRSKIFHTSTEFMFWLSCSQLTGLPDLIFISSNSLVGKDIPSGINDTMYKVFKAFSRHSVVDNKKSNW